VKCSRSLRFLHVFTYDIEGFLGGSVLTRLLTIDSLHIHIVILVRSSEKADKFNAISTYKNLTAVVGSIEELDKLESLAGKADYVFNCVRSVFGIYSRQNLILGDTSGGCGQFECY
jgi:uncharacterized protein YbjT (DUF2867 family)